jgi:hypothetical protein
MSQLKKKNKGGRREREEEEGRRSGIIINKKKKYLMIKITFVSQQHKINFKPILLHQRLKPRSCSFKGFARIH